MAETVRAIHKNLNVSPRKVRLVANAIRGRHVESALAELHIMTNRSAKPIAKLIRSAIANAREKKMNPEKLVIRNITVDQGITLRRVMPRARGRATPVRKTMSHITVFLVEDEKSTAPGFVLPEKPKRAKESRAPKRETPRPPAPKPDKAKETERARRGFMKKVFRRKAV